MDKNFLVEDYRLKIDYLNAHFSRMWTRFNFFLTLESGLLGFMFVGGDFSNHLPLFLLAQIVLSFIWWVFGAQDRWLVHAYRKSINEVASKMIETKLVEDDYQSVGNYQLFFDIESPSWFKNPIEWYSQRMSITRLTAYVPLFLLLVWLSLAVLSINPPNEQTMGTFYALVAAVIVVIFLIARAFIASGRNSSHQQ